MGNRTAPSYHTNVFALEFDVIVVVDFGSGAGQRLTRYVRSCRVYSEMWPATAFTSDWSRQRVKGVIIVQDGNETPEAERLYTELTQKGVSVFRLNASADLNETVQGRVRDFVFETCRCRKQWTMERFIDVAVDHIRRYAGSDAAVCGLSGGVDSAVAAALVERAIPDQLTTIFVDHGLLRKGEAEQVVQTFADRFGSRFVFVDARETFLNKLQGVSDPEAKRKVIGTEFIRTFEKEAGRVDGARYLVQGTLYSDVLESGFGGAEAIKSHHNVGGLPETMNLKLLEPLSSLFKDEVRSLGTSLGLPDDIVWRQPFPGPGLAIRIMGALTADKLAIAREADAVVTEEIERQNDKKSVWQYFAVLLDTRTVGVMDGRRTYGHVVAVRAVGSQDGTKARWARLPYDVLDRIAGRIMLEVPGVSRVVYDVSSKPPATIEWE